MKDFLNNGTHDRNRHVGDFLAATAIIERKPDSGDAYSEFQLEPTRLHDSRAEAVGLRAMPELIEHVLQTVFEQTLGSTVIGEPKAVHIDHGKTLFGGEMDVWYRDQRGAEIFADRYAAQPK